MLVGAGRKALVEEDGTEPLERVEPAESEREVRPVRYIRISPFCIHRNPLLKKGSLTPNAQGLEDSVSRAHELDEHGGGPVSYLCVPSGGCLEEIVELA